MDSNRKQTVNTSSEMTPSEMTPSDVKLYEKKHLNIYKANRKLKLAQKILEDAIDKYSGLTFDMCAYLKCSPKQLWNAIDRFGLRERMFEARNNLIDEAESTMRGILHSSDEKNALAASKFILERLGREKGWGQNPQIAQQINIASESDIKSIFGITEKASENDPA